MLFAYRLPIYCKDRSARQTVIRQHLRQCRCCARWCEGFSRPGRPAAESWGRAIELLLHRRSEKTQLVRLSKVASKSGVISSVGGSAWKWSVPPSEGHPQPYTFYAAQVAGSYVLISNNADDLGAISGKLSAMNAAPKLDGIREWATLSQHEVWGYRRYRHTEENKTAAGTSEVTPDTQALSFFADPKQKTGVLRLFSSTAGTADKMNATGTVPSFKAAGSGVWETTIPLTGDQKTSDQMFAAMSWFGFGVYV